MSHSSRIYNGTLAGVTSTPQALEPITHPSIREVIVQADPGNTTNALVGNSTAQYLVLVPGQGFSVPINNLNSLYVKMASGAGTINWIARD